MNEIMKLSYFYVSLLVSHLFNYQYIKLNVLNFHL